MQNLDKTNQLRVLITDPINQDSIEELIKRGWKVDQVSKLKKDELLEIVSNYEVIIGRTSTKIDKEIIDRAKKLKCIGIVSTGWDHIDIEAASERNVKVFGLPPKKEIIPEHFEKGSFIPTAEHTILYMLAAAGDFLNTANSMKRGEWNKFGFSGTELYGKTLGIIGLGRIGSLVAKRAQSFGMNVIANSERLTVEEVKERGAELVEFSDLLERSDYISLHVHQNEKTVGLIGEKEFKKMKDGVVLINTSRALVIDELALINVLDSKIKAAAIDVFKGAPNDINWDLVKHPKVIATPHIAGVSQEGQRRTAFHVVDSVYNYMKNGDVTYAINK
jgi:D-3-phosphoglycerate dehydrogenase / 2-oxoglutarate reductase